MTHRLLLPTPLLLALHGCTTLPGTATSEPTPTQQSPLEQRATELMQCIENRCSQQLQKRFVLEAMSYDNYYRWARKDIGYLFENAKAACSEQYRQLQQQASNHYMTPDQLNESFDKEGEQMCIQSIASTWRQQHSESQ